MIIIALTKNLHLPAPDALRAPEPAVQVTLPKVPLHGASVAA